MTKTNDHRETFGGWLLTQKGREGMVGELVAAAKVDRRFPRDGTPDEVRRHLSAMQPEGDLFAAVDDAETDWLAY